jgi:hypothetical protein
VFAVGYCEVVGSVEFGTCAEIDISMFVRIENRIKACLRRYVDWSGRKYGIFVGILR